MKDLLKAYEILLAIIIIWYIFLTLYAIFTGSEVAEKCAACVAIPTVISSAIVISIEDHEGR